MSISGDESTLARFLVTARQKVAEGTASMRKPTCEAALQLATDLHTLAGEAAMLDRPELASSAAEGEEAARLLAGGQSRAVVPCVRSLRRLGYLLQQEPAAPPQPSAGGEAGRTGGLRKLLVVDDSPVAALALADVFEMHEFAVRTASTLDQAIEQVASFSPTVLVSDVHMPNLDIVELCRRFRQTGSGRKSFVVLVSARTEAEVRDRLTEIKPDAFVSKLSGAAEVVACVRTICRELSQ
jgi:CheY-like chemotaxis protein